GDAVLEQARDARVLEAAVRARRGGQPRGDVRVRDDLGVEPLDRELALEARNAVHAGAVDLTRRTPADGLDEVVTAESPGHQRRAYRESSGDAPSSSARNLPTCRFAGTKAHGPTKQARRDSCAFAQVTRAADGLQPHGGWSQRRLRWSGRSAGRRARGR